MEDTKALPNGGDTQQAAAARTAVDFVAIASTLLRWIGGIALILRVCALPFVAGAAIYLAGRLVYESINHLAAFHFRVDAPLPALSAGSVVGATAFLCLLVIALVLTRRAKTLALAATLFGLWLVMLLILALLDMGLTSGALRFSSEATTDAWQLSIPPELLAIGKFLFAAIAALPVVPVSILLAVAAHEKPDQYANVAAAFGSLGAALLKIALTSAAFVFEAYFGVVILGYPPLMAIPAATLNAIAFAMALGQVEHAMHEKDKHAIGEWGFIAAGYAVLLLLVVYETALQFGGDKLAYVPRIPALRAVAETGYSVSIGLAAILIALTFIRKARRSVSGQPEQRTSLSDWAVNRVEDAAKIKAAVDAARGHLPTPVLSDSRRKPQPVLLPDEGSKQPELVPPKPDDIPVDRDNQNDAREGDGAPSKSDGQ